MSRENALPKDAFVLREEELLAPAGTSSAARSEVRSIPSRGLEPLLQALRSKPSRVTWIASRLTSPPFLCILQALDRSARVHLDVVAPFGDGCFPDALSSSLAGVIETWSDSWQLHVLEGPTYPGHVFIVDGRLLLCRDPLVTPTPRYREWVDIDLDAIPSLRRRLRRRRAACRVLAPGSLAHLSSEITSLPDFPIPISPAEQNRNAALHRILGVKSN